MSTILQSSSIWNKLERWKHSVSGCLMSWPQIKKIIILKCLLLFYATTSHFSIGLWCVMKSGFYMTMGEDQLSGWTEKKLQSTSQSQTSPKKRSSSLLGGLLPVWSTTAFWIPVKPLYLRSTLSNQRDALETTMPAASIGQQKGPNSSPQQCLTAHHTTNASQVERIGLQSFASSAIFTWLLGNCPPLHQASWQRFVGEGLPQPAGGRKCFPRVQWILKNEFLCYRNKQTYFSLAIICWL